MRVQDGTIGNSPYTFIEPAVSTRAPAPRTTWRFPPASVPPAWPPARAPPRPFAILDTVYQGIQTVLGAAPTTSFPALIVRLGQPGRRNVLLRRTPAVHRADVRPRRRIPMSSTSTSSRTSSATTSNSTSRAPTTSAASTACGDKLDPARRLRRRFRLRLRGHRAQRSGGARQLRMTTERSVVSGVFNVEDQSADQHGGAPNDDYGCWCSESSVYSILWDLYDNAADANDTMALGLHAHLERADRRADATRRHSPPSSRSSPALKARAAGRRGRHQYARRCAEHRRQQHRRVSRTGETHVPTNVPPPMCCRCTRPSLATVAHPVVVVRNGRRRRQPQQAGQPPLPCASRSTRSRDRSRCTAEFVQHEQRRSGFRVVSVQRCLLVEERPAVRSRRQATFDMHRWRPPTFSTCTIAPTAAARMQGVAGDYDLTVTIN